MSKASILVVDDDKAMAESISDVLDARGYRVAVANDGFAAVALAKETSFDLVLTDIKMPGMNGVEAYKEIKKIRPGMRAIMMTAYSVEDLIKEAMQEGAYEVMHKPIVLDRLLLLIEAITGKASIIVDPRDLSAPRSLVRKE